MISSGYTLRDYFQAHPEIEVDEAFLDKVCGPKRLKKIPPPVSVENPLKNGEFPDWKATAEHLQDQLTDVATNAAATLNEFGARSSIYDIQRAEQRTKIYQGLLRNAIAELEKAGVILPIPIEVQYDKAFDVSALYPSQS